MTKVQSGNAGLNRIGLALLGHCVGVLGCNVRMIHVKNEKGRKASVVKEQRQKE